METNEPVSSAPDTATRLLANVETVVRGKTEEIRLVLTALVCGGHVLLEDVPGTAKTVLARAIAGSVEGAAFSRIQCTPDLQPTDVTGLSVFNQRDRDFEFRPGPVFANVAPRRRDQPRDAEDAVGAPRGDGRAAGDDRRHHARAARAVPRARDREPDRAGGHVPATGGAARPFLPPHGARLPVGGRRGRDRRAAAAASIRSARCVRCSRSRRCTRCAVRSRPSTSTPSFAAGSSSSSVRHVQPEGVAIGASVRGSLALERAARAWALLERARLRHAGRRGGALPLSRDAPHRVHAELRGCGARDRLGGGVRPLPRPVHGDRAAAGRRARAGADEPTLAVAQ